MRLRGAANRVAGRGSSAGAPVPLLATAAFSALDLVAQRPSAKRSRRPGKWACQRGKRKGPG